ncbi:MAG TPA: hypothetical protein VFE23_20155 [Usitatibacter sp.]|nr:hypothetical protein [Usitatibacter sp.]
MCDAAALGVTDDNGYFDWPTHIGRQTYVIAYKPGYVSLPALDSQDRRAVSVIKSPSRESTMANFDALVSAANCINVGADGEAIEEFFIPILAEAKSQARSSGNEKTIRRIEGVIWAYQRSSK